LRAKTGRRSILLMTEGNVEHLKLRDDGDVLGLV